MAGSTVAVIGGGPLGLMALKGFTEDGFDATLFESRDWVGGLWRHSSDESISAAANTIFNSSKYRSAITDFPMPDDMDDFPTAARLQRYFESYCDHFDLWPHIKLNSPIGKVKRNQNDWTLKIGSKGNSASRTEHFDKVVFACGTFLKPRIPDLEGIEKFEGKSLHSIQFTNAAQFKGKNVIVMGMHASAQDTVSGLSPHVSKVYLSHRSGVVILPRYGPDGSVYDRQPGMGVFIVMLYFSVLLPSLYQWLIDAMIGKMSKKAYPNVPAAWNFSPAPSTAVTPPMIASELWPHLESGLCEPVADIAHITGPRTVELSDGRFLDDVDVVIYCTGYHACIPVPLEPEELNPFAYPGAIPVLYRNIFSLNPDSAIRNSIAFLGQAGAQLPGFAQFEMQSMSVSQIWLGRSSLPSLVEMQKWHHWYMAWRERTAKKYGVTSTFYSVFVPTADHFAWCDETAGLGLRARFGLIERWTRREAWELWWNDKELYGMCLTGLTTPAIFRLFDVGKRKVWAGARKQVVIENKKVERQQKERQRAMMKEV